MWIPRYLQNRETEDERDSQCEEMVAIARFGISLFALALAFYSLAHVHQ
jgi:hypothetical protein